MSGRNTTSSQNIQYHLRGIYGPDYFVANTAKDDMVCPECKNSIMSYTKCHKRLMEIKESVLEKGRHSREKRPLPTTPSLSPTKQPQKKMKTASSNVILTSPLVQVCWWWSGVSIIENFKCRISFFPWFCLIFTHFYHRLQTIKCT